MLRLSAAFMALLLLAPLAGAVETLDDLEEVHEGQDALFPVVVTAEDAGKLYGLVYRNAPRHGFGVVVYNATGDEVFVKNGSRGLQTLRGLDAPGEYRFFLRGNGSFQVTERFLDQQKSGEKILEVNETLRGADAYILNPTDNYTLVVTGDVRTEFFDMIGALQNREGPGNMSIDYGHPGVITVRGAEGTPYSLHLVHRDVPVVNEAPGAGVLLALVAVGAALLVARLTRRT